MISSSQRKLTSFLCMVLLFILSSTALCETSLKGWNSKELVSLYFHNSELQTQWAWAALSKYTFKGNENVLDFGSGDGKLSAMMSFMVPKGSVTGVDISEEMTAYASKMFLPDHYKNLTFFSAKHENFSGAEFSKKFDLVTLFCVLHLVPDPLAVLKSIKQHMQSKAKIVATYPIEGNPEFYRALGEELTERKIAIPMPTEGSKTIRDPAKIYQLFKQAGFTINQLQVIGTRNSFGTKKELVDWFEGTLTGNWNIPAAGRREFFTRLADRYLKYRPQDIGTDGFVYFSMYRIDLLATNND